MPAEERLGLDIKRAEQELIAAKSVAVKAAGVTVPQYAALFALSGSPGISAAALARACLVTPQAMSVVLKNLEERALIERTQHPWHHNVLETRLTGGGRAVLAVADERAVVIERRIAGEFTAEERQMLRSLLGRAIRAIRDEGGAGS
ncbi:MarR family transcriptional regulator [Streptomyces sp. H10-C2]|uniref:MarR family winged helix-turn-helix transcriptional regulator n=1 Tax=unclassified Streptomyces TaxID=2593676 RepID=UPI0024BB547B|nr:MULTISPECIES: MarR family transcriptional regulator [unclassified Streptomyces]MDJ0343363.1 MarR family transcriptional regulator [Streptomyces sp. PH10-H1]MDJ0371826.1 MarR family transcriptional regulator [Streptomyces sp. H10-C2]